MPYFALGGFTPRLASTLTTGGLHLAASRKTDVPNAMVELPPLG